MRALRDGPHQYPPMLGIPALRQAVAENTRRFHGFDVDWEREVLVTSGATEALADAFFGLLNPGDEVILIEPAYDSYPVIIRRAGAIPVPVRLSPPHWELPRDQLEAAITPRTRAIVINTPINPIGKIFDDDDLRFLADCLLRYDLIAIADEVYEHLVFDRRRHKSLFAVPEVRDRIVRIGSAGKTFSVTGWKVGYVTADARLPDADLARASVRHLHHAPGAAERRRLRPGPAGRLFRRSAHVARGAPRPAGRRAEADRLRCRGRRGDLFRGRRRGAIRRGGRRRRILPPADAPGGRNGGADFRILQRRKRADPYPLLLRQAAGDFGFRAFAARALERARRPPGLLTPDRGETGASLVYKFARHT